VSYSAVRPDAPTGGKIWAPRILGRGKHFAVPREPMITLMPEALSTLWRVAGPRGVFQALKPRLASRMRCVRFAIDLHDWAPPRATPSVEVRHGIAELERLRQRRAGLPPQFYLDRLRGVRRPYLGFWDGQIGHISWLLTPSDRPRLIVLGPEEVELDGAFTLPEARGRGLLSAVECAMLADAKSEGYARAYTHVAADNIASLRGVKKTGFSEIGILTQHWMLGVQWISHAEEKATVLQLR
jgi:GNAT superfamily N-acetyltransferase